MAHDVSAPIENLARRWGDQIVDTLEGRGLASAITADKAHDLAAFEGESDVAQIKRRIMFTEMFDPQ